VDEKQQHRRGDRGHREICPASRDEQAFDGLALALDGHKGAAAHPPVNTRGKARRREPQRTASFRHHPLSSTGVSAVCQ